MSSENTIWVDFSKAPSPAPPTMIHELVTLGFKFWPGKGYWR
jgi:RNA polymerase primary sigma factor